MHRTPILIASVLVVGLALGLGIGPLIRGSVASAQTSSTPTPAATSGTALKDLFLDKLAAALNIQRSALDSDVKSAGSSAIDAAVQQGTLTQAQADQLKARVQAGDYGALLGGGRGGPGAPGGGPRGDNGVFQALFNAAAQKLGITSDELRTQLRNGQTLAQLAAAHNTTEQAVIDAALAAAKAQLNTAVSSGSLTQAQADAIYARLQQQGAQLFTQHGGPGGHSGRPGNPRPTPSAAPTT